MVLAATLILQAQLAVIRPKTLAHASQTEQWITVSATVPLRSKVNAGNETPKSRSVGAAM